MTTKSTLRTVVSLAALLLAPAAPSGSPHDKDAIFEALLERELAARELAFQLAQIKSEQDLKNYLVRHANDDTPLSQLSKDAQDRFLRSLVFTGNGLASFDYSDLRAELTASQIYRILELFGAQHSTKFIPNLRVINEADLAVIHRGDPKPAPLNDYPDYRCSAKATCEYSPNKICIGSNCMVP